VAHLLIAVIYLAFVSMGLPDALLGAAWPTIYPALGVPISYAGLLTILIAAGTVVSSLSSNRMLLKFGTGKITAFCTLLTAVALFGFSSARAFWQLCIWALPYGLGAGSIDAALNNYVALHFKSRHMSWIHFFWGVGATTGPYLMGALLTGGQSWTRGYMVVGVIQAAMTILMFFALPVWKRDAHSDARGRAVASARQVLAMPGAKAVLIAFFCYCALESTTGLWISSYMNLNRGVPADVAAKWASIFFLGITVGRFLCGFVVDRIGDKNMVRLGQAAIVAGVALIFLSRRNALCFTGIVLIGLGCAPIYPSLLHETPQNFGPENSQAIMGVQMACAYTGTTLIPPLFGVVADRIDIAALPFCLLLLIVVMIATVERLNAAARRRAGKESLHA
jgi:fucose permease